MITILFILGLWLVFGFYAARTTYYAFIEYASIGGPVWDLTILLFVTGPLGFLVGALSDWGATKAALKNEKSPDPVQKPYVTYFNATDEFDKNLESWSTLRNLLLIPKWDGVRVEPVPRYY